MASDKARDEENRRRTFHGASRIFRGAERSMKAFIAFALNRAFLVNDGD